MRQLTLLSAGALLAVSLWGCEAETPQPAASGGSSTTNPADNPGSGTPQGDVSLGEPGDIKLGEPASATGTVDPSKTKASSDTEGPILPEPKNR